MILFYVSDAVSTEVLPVDRIVVLIAPFVIICFVSRAGWGVDPSIESEGYFVEHLIHGDVYIMPDPGNKDRVIQTVLFLAINDVNGKGADISCGTTWNQGAETEHENEKNKSLRFCLSSHSPLSCNSLRQCNYPSVFLIFIRVLKFFFETEISRIKKEEKKDREFYNKL